MTVAERSIINRISVWNTGRSLTGQVGVNIHMQYNCLNSFVHTINLGFIIYTLMLIKQVVVAEWLRRWTRNPLGSSRAGSNPADNGTYFFYEKNRFMVFFQRNAMNVLLHPTKRRAEARIVM